jgi:hypothetical protein
MDCLESSIAIGIVLTDNDAVVSCLPFEKQGRRISMRITFDTGAVGFILDTFGKAIHNGYVVEKSDPKQRVVTPRGEEVPVDEFAGIRKGSAVFVKTDIVSLIEAAEAMA